VILRVSNFHSNQYSAKPFKLTASVKRRFNWFSID